MNTDWLIETLDPAALTWLQGAAEKVQPQHADNDIYCIASAQVRRKVGTTPLPNKRVAHSKGELEISGWDTADAARTWLLLAYLSNKPNRETRLRDAYRAGDEWEKATLLRGLMWSDPEGSGVDFIVDTCRVNSLSIFSAIALNNAYPAYFFPERAFNQLCLKSLFQGLSITQLIGLPERGNIDLSRIAFDYAHERLDAKREIPASLWLALAPHADNDAIELLLEYLERGGGDHPACAALAIAQNPQRFHSYQKRIQQIREQLSSPIVSELLKNL